jgi:hypothetical protein
MLSPILVVGSVVFTEAKSERFQFVPNVAVQMVCLRSSLLIARRERQLFQRVSGLNARILGSK